VGRQGGERTDPFIISESFDILKSVINNIPSRQLQNTDETSFCLDPSRIWVLGGDRYCFPSSY
jgi:hypothetical protein